MADITYPGVSPFTQARDIRSLSMNGGGPTAGFRNRIINGAMRVAQLGTAFPFMSTGVGVDNYSVIPPTGTANQSMNLIAFAAGQTAVPGEPTNYLEYDVTGVSTLPMELRSSIEDVRTFAGQVCTLSFWAKCNSSTFNLGHIVEQFFGTGGSGFVDSSQTNFVLTTTWQKFTRTLTLPSIAGKTITADSTIRHRFLIPTGVANKLHIALIQWEFGDIDTPFETRPLAVEELMCYRYMQRFGGSIAANRVGNGFANSNAHGFVDLHYVKKFDIPSVAIGGGTTEFQIDRQGSGTVAVTGLIARAGSLSKTSCELDATVASGLTSGEAIGLRALSVNGYIDVKANL